MGPVNDRGGPGISLRPASVACTRHSNSCLGRLHMQPRGATGRERPIRRWTGLGPQDAEGRRPAFTARRTEIAFSAPQNPRSADRPKSLTDSGPVKPSMQGPLNPEMPRPRPVNATLPPGKATPPPRKRRDPRRGSVLRWPETGSNCRPSTFQADALPTELSGQRSCLPAFSATLKGLEPSTSAVTGRRANQLRHRASK